MGISPQDKRPHMPDSDGGRGISRQNDQIPHVSIEPGGGGTSRQRCTEDIVPLVNDVAGARGTARQNLGSYDDLCDGRRLFPKFYAICDRLANVVVLNRDWTSAVTPTMLGDTPSHPNANVGVFIDPPYLSERRNLELYSTDGNIAESDRVAMDSYLWAVKHGDRYRIAYACHDGDFPVPEGWDVIRRGFRGIRNQDRRKTQGDMLMFSAACTVQLDLLNI